MTTACERTLAQLHACGLAPYLGTWTACGDGMMGAFTASPVALLRADARFAEGWMSTMHDDVGHPRTEFRSYRGTLGAGSLQVVINTATGAFYADVDRWNPYADVVNFCGHAFGEVLPDFCRRAWRWLTRA